MLLPARYAGNMRFLLALSLILAFMLNSPSVAHVMGLPPHVTDVVGYQTDMTERHLAERDKKAGAKSDPYQLGCTSLHLMDRPLEHVVTALVGWMVNRLPLPREQLLHKGIVLSPAYKPPRLRA